MALLTSSKEVLGAYRPIGKNTYLSYEVFYAIIFAIILRIVF